MTIEVDDQTEDEIEWRSTRVTSCGTAQAVSILGVEVVTLALGEGVPDVDLDELVSEVRAHATTLFELRAFALAQPFDRLCGVVWAMASELPEVAALVPSSARPWRK